MAAELDPRRREIYWGATAEVLLPSYLEDKTSYEFRHASHPIRSITVDRVGMETAKARAWLRHRRDRMVFVGSVTASEPEPFDNDTLFAEGCVLEHPSLGSIHLYLIVVETHPEFLTLLVEVEASAGGLVRALVERLVEQPAPPEPVEGWRWRAIDNAWLPVPESATDPSRYIYAADDVELSLERCEPSELGVLSPIEGMVSARESIQLTTLHGYAATLLFGEGVGDDGERIFLASAVVVAKGQGVHIQARGAGVRADLLESQLPEIVSSIRVGIYPAQDDRDGR